MAVITEAYRLGRGYAISPSRYDTIKQAGRYQPLEQHKSSRDIAPFVYLTKVPRGWSNHAKDNAEYTLNNGKSNVSSIYIPEPLRYPNVGFGDMKGTNDALIIHLSEDCNTLSIMVARGQKLNARAVYEAYIRGELNHDIHQLEEQAVHIEPRRIERKQKQRLQACKP